MCERAGQEVQGGQEFQFWELAVCSGTGSGNTKTLETFAWKQCSPLLFPAAKGSKQFLLFLLYTEFLICQ